MKEIVDTTTEKQPVKVKKLGGRTGKGFMPGVSGNPKGRPKGSRNLSVLFNDAIEAFAKLAKKKGIADDMDVEIDIVKKMLDKARTGDPHAMKLYFEYRFGKARHQEDDTLKVIVEEGLNEEEKEMIKQALKHAGLSNLVTDKKK